jgi:hypothetical protein
MQSQTPIVQVWLKQLSECLTPSFLGVVWPHNLAKYLAWPL